MRQRAAKHDLCGRDVVITRPAGTGGAVARRVRAAGGVPVRLPGMALRGIGDTDTRNALAQAMTASRVIFASPAAVRFAAALQPFPPGIAAIGVGEGTRQALHRAGVASPDAPVRQDSEGVLAMPVLQCIRGVRIALVGAAGGRGLLRSVLEGRGAVLEEVHVYRRLPPRLDRRHLAAIEQLSVGACVLWSSAEAMTQLQGLLPAAAWARLCRATAVTSSVRLGDAARAAGFRRCVLARSAGADDLVAAAAVLCHDGTVPGDADC